MTSIFQICSPVWLRRGVRATVVAMACAVATPALVLAQGVTATLDNAASTERLISEFGGWIGNRHDADQLVTTLRRRPPDGDRRCGQQGTSDGAFGLRRSTPGAQARARRAGAARRGLPQSGSTAGGAAWRCVAHSAGRTGDGWGLAPKGEGHRLGQHGRALWPDHGRFAASAGQGRDGEERQAFGHQGQNQGGCQGQSICKSIV